MPELTTRATKGSALTHAELDANFKRTVTQKTTTYACLVSDNRSVIEGNHASTPFTITLGDATTMVAGDTGDYEVTITNVGAAVVTVARAGSDTIDGAATSLTLGQYDTVTLQVNSAGDGYLSTAGKIPGLTSTVAELNILDGVTSTASELNILDGVTSTASELNILDGVTATATELNYSDGVTSNIQTQLDGKLDNDGHGRVFSTTGSGTVGGPSGFTYSWAGAGCTITHNIGTTNYTVLATAYSTQIHFVTCSAMGSSSCIVAGYNASTQAAAAAEFYFQIIPD